jgi:two-component system cell cycle sensor histidine kinase PleC
VWTGALTAGIWTSAVLLLHVIIIAKCRQFLTEPPASVNIRRWRSRFVTLDLFYGLGWMFNLVHPIGSDAESGTFILFVMLIVVAVSSMLASSLPTAVFAATFPVTAAIALDFILVGTMRGYILAMMAVTAQGYFALLAYRLYSTTLATHDGVERVRHLFGLDSGGCRGGGAGGCGGSFFLGFFGAAEGDEGTKK